MLHWDSLEREKLQNYIFNISSISAWKKKIKILQITSKLLEFANLFISFNFTGALTKLISVDSCAGEFGYDIIHVDEGAWGYSLVGYCSIVLE